MKYLILILILTACDEACGFKTNQEVRQRIFMQCLDKMQAIAPKADRTELEEAIDSCESAAYWQSQSKEHCKEKK